MRFDELHVELPGVDLGFLGSVDALPQLEGLHVVLFVKGQQVGGRELHGGVRVKSTSLFRSGQNSVL